jgi:hypothetical protein
MKLFGGKKITGGTASRAEVYGLFIATVVLLGGGGAVAYSASGGFDTSPTPEISETATPSASPLETQEPDTGSTNNDSNTGSTNTESNTGSTNTESNTGSTTVCKSAYWDSVRASKQYLVDMYQSEVNALAFYVKNDQDQLTAHRNGLPTEPIRVQINNDVFELTGLELEAYFEERITNNSATLARNQLALNNAIAELNSVPTC